MQQYSLLEDLRKHQEVLRESQMRDSEEARNLLKKKQEAQIRLEEEANLERDARQELYREQGKREEVIREIRELEAEENDIIKRLDAVKETLAQSPQKVK